MSKPLPPGIDRLPSGLYRARYRDATGIQHSRSFGLLRDAKAWRNAQLHAVAKGRHVAPNDRTTVHEYATLWAGRRTGRDGTLRQDVTYLRHLADTTLGAKPIAQVKPADIQSFIADRDRVYAASTVRNLYAWVKAIFTDAVENDRIAKTPCISKIKVRQPPRTKVEPLTVAQVRGLAGCTVERYRIGVTLQAALGLRASELLGLQVRDVDFLRREVHIERQLARNGREFAEPKTKHSYRTIPLATDVATALSAHLQRFPAARDGVILATTAGNPVRQDRWAEVFTAAVTEAGLPEDTTSHDLRHHFASVLLRQGVPVNVVANYLGHGSAALVLSTYGHLMPDSHDLVRNALESLWSEAAVSPGVSYGPIPRSNG